MNFELACSEVTQQLKMENEIGWPVKIKILVKITMLINKTEKPSSWLKRGNPDMWQP